jgi:hypothetical protein
MTAVDALAAAEFGDVIITSPNCKYLFQPLINPRTVQLRSDYRFGADDPILYPQWLRTTLYHHMLILTKPTEGLNSVLWWNGTASSFVQASEVMVGGVGFVQGAEMEALEKLMNTLTVTIKSDLPPNFSKLDPKEQESLRLRCAQLEKSWYRLSTHPGDLEEKCLQVTEFQRLWLEVEAFHRFVTRVRTDLWTKTKPPSGTWKSIGAFTSSEKEAQDCFNAGVPIFLVRPKTKFRGSFRIDSIVPLRTPESEVVETLQPNIQHPVIYKGDPMSISHNEAQVLWLRNRHLPQHLLEDHISRVSGPSKLSF